MPFVPNEFLSHIKSKGGPAKTNRYQALIPLPKIIRDEIPDPDIVSQFLQVVTDPLNVAKEKVQSAINNNESVTQISRYLALQCESTNFPSKSLQVTAAKTYGPVFKIPTAVEYGNFSMTFMCTNDFFERKLFERWLEIIVPTTTNDFRFPRGDKIENSYLSQISVFQYDDFVRQVYGITLQDAFPISINDQVVSWTDDNFHRITINFAYHKYKTIYEGKFDTDAIVGSVLSTPGGAFESLKTAFTSLANPFSNGGLLDPATNFSGYGVFR